MASWILVHPETDGLKHVFLDLHALVTDSGVVESPEDVVHDLVDGDTGMLPRVQNTSMVD